jgi:hypothetical protein
MRDLTVDSPHAPKYSEILGMFFSNIHEVETLIKVIAQK